MHQGLLSRDPRSLAHADESAMAAYCDQSEDDIRALTTRALLRSQSTNLGARNGSLTRSTSVASSTSAGRPAAMPE